MPRSEPILVQAPVKALDEDGASVAAIGTIAFAVATVILRLTATPQWWLWVALTGTVIGMAFLTYCLVRRRWKRSSGRRG